MALRSPRFSQAPASTFSFFLFHFIHTCQHWDKSELNKAHRAQYLRGPHFSGCTSIFMPYRPCLPHPSPALTLLTKSTEHTTTTARHCTRHHSIHAHSLDAHTRGCNYCLQNTEFQILIYSQICLLNFRLSFQLPHRLS